MAKKLTNKVKSPSKEGLFTLLYPVKYEYILLSKCRQFH